MNASGPTAPGAAHALAADAAADAASKGAPDGAPGDTQRRAAGARLRWLETLGLPLAIAVYLALRASILYTAFDSTAMTMYELFPMGALAELLRRGIDIPLSYFYDNAAGQILIGALTVPFFAVFGPSYLALKLVPLTLGLGTLIVLHRFLAAHFSRAAANVGAFLFAIGPTTLVKYSLMNSGNHFENLFFSMTALACFYRLHATPSRRWLWASGFSAGFALFVFLGALIPVGTCVAMHLGIRGWRRSLRDLAALVPAFLLGLAPLIVLNFATGARGLGFLGAKFADNEAAASGPRSAPVLERTLDFLTVHMPHAGVYESWAGLPGSLADALFLCAFVLAWLACIPGAWSGLLALARGVFARDDATEQRARFERAKIVPLVLYLPLAALAYGLSNFRIGGHAAPIEVAGYRYFLPHLLFAVALIAIVATRWWRRPRALVRVTAAGLAGSALCAGMFNLAIVDPKLEHANLGVHYEGYNMAQVARALLSTRNQLSRAEIVARVESFPPLMRQQVINALGFNLAVRRINANRTRDPAAWSLDLPGLLANFPDAWHADVAHGVGIALRWSARLAVWEPSELERVLLDIATKAGGLGACVVEGACFENVQEPLERNSHGILDFDRALLARAPEALRPALAYGTGWLCGRLFSRSIASEETALVHTMYALRPADHAEFYAGYGHGMADVDERGALPPGWRKLVPEAQRPRALEGFASGLARVHGSEAAARLAAALASALDAGEQAALTRGLALAHPLRR